MGKRALQLALVACVGAFLAWMLTREDEGVRPGASRVPDRPVAQDRIQRKTERPAVAASREPAVSFNLPKMRPPAPEPPPPAAFSVPKYWLLRGSASKNYELRSDRSVVLSGNHSAVLSSHEKDVQPNLSGSAVQAVLASPYVGTRVELSAALRAEDARQTGCSIWIYVTDPARVVIAYQIVQMEAGQLAGEWQRYRIVMDVPWHGEVLAYGFTLQGKGKVWADDMKLTPVDVNVPATGVQNAHQLGVIAQAVSLDGALANPTNMDFEDVQLTRERQPEAPRDEIKGTRF